MRQILALSTALLLLCASERAVDGRAQETDRSPASFTVGALRRDSVVIPFAMFDGTRWSDRWPSPQRNQPIPINLSSVPARWWGPAGPRETWQAWTPSGATTIHVLQPDQVDVHCTSQIGLRTDYRPAELPPPWREQPYPKDGLAISPPHPIDSVDLLQSGAPELLPLGPPLKRAFDKAERETASAGHPFKAHVRESSPPEIEAAYAYGTNPRFYYIESVRTYRTLGGSDCVIGFGTGWFRRDGGSFTPLTMTVDALACDRYGATYMNPFGVITLGGKTYWLAQFSGWDHERFVVLELKPTEVVAVVNAWGGGC